MNLRISNLSYQRNMSICATDSADPFDGTALYTTTDATLALVPNEGNKIEGTIKFTEDDLLVTLATDIRGENVIVSHNSQDDLIVPLSQNIAIEWDVSIKHIHSY